MVAVVAVVAVAALPEIDPVIVELTVKPVRVPTVVIPVYDPEIRAESTVPEVIVARHMDMEVFGLSVVTDMGDEENIEEVNHAEVLKAAEKAEPSVRKLIKELISQY